MAQEKIKCPKCGAQFELTEVISKEIEATISQKYEAREKELMTQLKSDQKKIAEQAKKEAEEAIKVELLDIRAQLDDKSKKLDASQQKELALLQKEHALQEKEKTLELEATKKLAVKEKEIRESVELERKAIEDKARKQAEQSYLLELKDAQEQLIEKSKQLEKSQQQELELRKRQRELEEKEKTLELEAMRRVDAEKNKILEEVTKQFEEQHRLKDAEKDKKLADMTRQIDELKRKAEQGSQQAQGEVLELDLEMRLKTRFPIDNIESVEKGTKGADLLQTVLVQSGRVCGKILWETKRAKNWSDTWVQKVKDDQLAAKADISVIVSEILPKGVQQFEYSNGVWITDIPSAINLAMALRVGMIEVSRERELQAGKQGKMELVYNYLTGVEFKNRVEAILQSFVAMKGDLEKEKRALQSIWAKREKQIERVICNISGMHGDLEGIAGMALPSIKTLELPVVDVEVESEENKDESVNI